MTKRFFLTAAVALLFTACAKDEVDVVTPNPNQGPGKVTIGASFEANATKSDIDDNGNFTWSTADGIKVYSNTNKWSVLDIVDGESAQELGPKFEFANFTTYSFQGDYISKAAVFPKTITPSYSNDALSLALPSEIAWNDSSLDDLTVRTMQADNVMVALGFADGASTVDFKNVGGLFRLTLNNVPVGATKLEFITQQKINGTFDVITEENNVQLENPYIATSNTYAEGENIITINFTTLTAPTKMVFFIPVPVGAYQIGFAVKDGEDNIKWQFHSTATNSVERAHMIKMPTLSHITVGGGGEGATNIIVTPTAYSGTVNLPSTQNNIYVKMNETDGEINLEYSTAANAAHPANVYLQALGDVNTLNINLPDSHVELTGNGNDVQIVTNVTASTTINTFVVDNKVQIGKTVENTSVGGLTINGGSLDLSAKVEGPVTVVYDVVAETVNKTSEKVSININSAIKDLVVTSASTQSAPDKIYVTLSSSSKVNETLSVPETNCNLYIAPGAQAKTVETSAAENTIAGAVQNLAAEGDGTSVVVEKQGSVTESITSSDKASIVIVERTDAEVAAQTAGAITTNTSTSTQGTIDTVEGNAVAMIGSTSYASLEVAFAAVADGQTIKLIADVNLGSTPFVVSLGEKNVTLDLGGKTLTGRTNLTSGNLTIQNGKVVNAEQQPLNVYGSSTPGAQNYSVLTVARDVTVEGGYGVCMFGAPASTAGYGAVANIAGTLKAEDGVFVSGNLGNNIAPDMNNIVNLTGKIEATGTGIALNGWATVNVQSGANVTANTGVGVKRGVLNVYDGATVTGNGQWVTPPAANNNGTEPTGAAVSMTSTYNQYGAMAVNIAGGTFKSVNGEALYKADQNYSNAATFTVTGGTFSSDPSAFVPAGLEAVKNGNVWTVQNSTYKASIGSKLYETLDAAIEAAANGAKIDILVDQTIDKGWTLEKSLEINLNNKTLTFSGETLANYPSQRVFVVNGEADLNIHDGSILLTEHNGNTDATNLWGTVRFYSSGTLTMTNVVTDNYCKNGLNVKMLNGTGVFNNVTIKSKFGGAVEVGGDKTNHTVATATFTNCNFTNESTYDWCSTTVATCYNGVANIESGNYSGYYGIYVFSSGGTINVAKGVSITGTAYSVVSEKDQSNYAAFNDGIVNIAGGKITGPFRIKQEGHDHLNISGGTYTVDPSNYVVSGYTANHTGNVWTVTPVNGVAAIGSTGYPTLAGAIAAVPDGTETTITVLSNISLTSGVTIAANKNVVLELNGKTISEVLSQSGTSALITNNGTLTIQDNTDTQANGTGKGKITYNNGNPDQQAVPGYASNTIINQGNLTINSGYIENTTTGGYAAYTVDNLTNGGLYTPVFTMNGGKLYNNYTDAIRMFLNSTTKLNKVVINGGVLDSDKASGRVIVMHLPSSSADNAAMGELKITDGTILGKVNAWSAANAGGVEDRFGDAQYQNVTIAISGGSIDELDFSPMANETLRASSLSVTGGTYNVDPSAYVANGYEAVKNGNVWNVVKLPDVAEIGNTRYPTLAAAVAAVPTDGTKTTIRMIANETMATGATLEVASTKNIVLDLNGKTVAGNGGVGGANFFFLTNRGILEITDSSAGQNGKITGYWTNPNTGYSNQYNTIYNIDGKLTLSAGTVEATSGYLSYAVNNSSNAWGAGDDKETVFTMTGGTVTAPSGDAAVRVYQNCGSNSNPYSHNTLNISGGLIKDSGIFIDTYIYKANPASSGDHINTTINISGGEIHGLIDLKMRHPYNTTVNVTGGSFRSSTLRVRKYVTEWGTGLAEPTEPVFNISNGNFQFANTANVSDAFAIMKSSEPSNVWSTYTNQYSITGGTFNVDPSAYVAVGYAATQTQNGWVVAEVEGVAQIGNQPYDSLIAAIAAVPDNGQNPTTIRMIANETMAVNTVIEIAATKNIVLDLNGKTVSSTGGSTSESYYFIQNRGTLEITDLSSGKNGKITSACTNPSPGYSKEYVTIYNIGGNLTLTEGTVEITSGGLSYAINSSSNAWGSGDDKESVFTMKGGTITAPSGDASLRVYQNCADSNNNPLSHNTVNIQGGLIMYNGIFIDTYLYKPNPATTSDHVYTNVTISGGEVDGLIDLKMRHPYNTSVNIKGGTFRNSMFRVRKYVAEWDSNIPEPKSPVFNISGGDVEFADANNAFVVTKTVNENPHNVWTSYANQYSITGGTFNVDPSYFVADSHGAVFTTGGKYLVTNANWADAAASNADFEAATDGTTINISSAALLAKFAKNVNEGVSNYEGYTVNITADIDLSGKVWTPIGLESYGRRFQGTFNGNNYTISNMSVKDVENSGLFGTLHGGTIQNVKIDNFIVVSHHYAGPVLAWGESSAIKNIIDHCVVSNGTVITTPHVVDNKWDDGDKAGGLCGWVAVNNVEVTNNSVSNVKITAYRDLGGLLGYANTAIVTGNTVQNVTVKQSNVHAYRESVSTYGELIGRIEGVNTIENNTTSSVTVSHD